MRTAAIALTLAWLTMPTLLAPAYSQEAKQDFDLVNQTGYQIKAVYVSPGKSDDWEEDVLGEDLLDQGDTWQIRFHRSEKTCHWDLKVVYADDGSSAVWQNIDLCSVDKITIHYNRKTDTTSATFD
jgi:hypothetical protein